MRKLCSKWAPRLLTVNQKQRVDNLEHCLQLFQCNQKRFLRNYVIMDETWIHHFTLQSAVTWEDGSRWNRPKRSKTQTSAGKVLASIFWDARGILFIDYLVKGRTINSEYYIALLVRLKEKFTKKRPQKKRKKYSSTKTMHRVTSWLQRWQNYLNCTYVLTLFSRSGPPLTTGCLQTSKEYSRERDLAPMKKWDQKLRCILRRKINRSTKKASNCWNQCITLEGHYINE